MGKQLIAVSHAVSFYSGAGAAFALEYGVVVGMIKAAKRGGPLLSFQGVTLLQKIAYSGVKWRYFMKREFLQNFKVGDQPLPKEVIDAIMAENGRDIEATKAHAGGNGGSDGKMFTQEDVNRIVSERLAREREKPVDDEREKNLKAREARLDCRDYLDSKKYPAKLLDLLDSSDVEKFKSAADAMIEGFPSIMQPESQMPPPYAAGTGTGSYTGLDKGLADAFKPKT